MNDKNKKKLIAFLSLLIAVSLCSVLLLLPKMSKHNSVPQEPVVTEEVEMPNFDDEIAVFDANKEINDDYVGQLVFKSGLIDLPVVQSHLDDVDEAYDEYLRTAWDTMEHDEEGSIFVDPTVNVEVDGNIVIYGHYVYPHLDPEQTHKFSPLHVLKEEQNYEENKNFHIIFENQIRAYEIAYVYYAEIEGEGEEQVSTVNYMYPNYTEEEFYDYLNIMEEKAFYDTGVDINYEDYLLTLQTCVKDRDDLRLIVVAREVTSVITR